jgi:hypothetical protein
VKRSAFPQVRVLGQIPGTVQYRDVANYKQAITFQGVAILRFDADLYFANAGARAAWMRACVFAAGLSNRVPHTLQTL